MTIASVERFAAKRLANTLESAGLVEDFRIAPFGK